MTLSQLVPFNAPFRKYPLSDMFERCLRVWGSQIPVLATAFLWWGDVSRRRSPKPVGLDALFIHLGHKGQLLETTPRPLARELEAWEDQAASSKVGIHPPRRVQA